ncbi:MAG TPA: multicopper oxidase domain-containing protein [Polyangiaceae bacterium]|nr:multicopper oxidase domain-containing protein [Polyangiaceae bacterium]
MTEPAAVASHDGQLSIDLTAAPGQYAIGSERIDGMLYNGSYVPPVWHVKPGDTLMVALHNRLREPTNLYFHGLHVSPLGNGDNVFVHIAPDESFQYRVPIPSDHDPGLYWFHTHAHGLVSAQIRIGNISADLFLKLKLDGASRYAIATDGHPLLRPKRIDETLLGPGQRIEVVVTGPPDGRYAFRSIPFVLEEGRPPLPEHVLGVLISSGRSNDATAAENRIAAASAQPTPAFQALSTSAITTRRTFVFRRSMDRAHFYINGKLFGDPGTELTIPLGSVEEWTILNEDNQLHNFHVHQTVFLVTEIDGSRQPMDSLFDTITVPPDGSAAQVPPTEAPPASSSRGR